MRTEVETLMKVWQDAWFTKNGRTIAAMMTDDYIYVAPGRGQRSYPGYGAAVRGGSYLIACS